MGGKSKQRVKSNAKPSSSSRSAELVGSTGFVGFAAHADLGLVPYVPGFSTLQAVSESFDVRISTDFQLVFRKMSKKDPMTKKKALQEFVELVNKSDEEDKAVLPLWPKYYQNLSTDTEHVVRELSQTALRALVSKYKRNVAPILKQIVPHWLMSQFDNYAPSASTAALSFRETFASNVDRTQEVLLHCQSEIVSTAMRYLTYHTPATLSSAKGSDPEDAAQKYQRAAVGCLKMLSYFIEKTRDCDQKAMKVMANLKELIENKKFWSLSTHKSNKIRAAWFEFLYNVLQSEHFKEILEPMKGQLTTLCFQNIDQTDAAVASLAWGCVLLIQDSDDDWHKSVNFQAKILPKIFHLLRNGLNRNATAIAPNLLPFFSKLTPEIFEEESYYKFCERFFSELKQSITIESPYSVVEMSAIIRANFECLRYLSQKLNQNNDPSSEQDALGLWIVKENLIGAVIWFLENKSTSVKYYFEELSALIAFWATHSVNNNTNEYKLCTQLLETFWQSLAETAISNLKNPNVSEKYLENLSLLLQDLRTANPYMEKQKITFCDQVQDDEEQPLCNAKQGSSNDCSDTKKSPQHNKILYEELKCLAIQLGKLCMEINQQQPSVKYIKFIRLLTKMFNDHEFFKSLSGEEDSVTATLNTLTSSFESENSDEEMQDLLVNVIFEILQNLEAAESLAFIKSHLLKDFRRSVQILILQRLLAYPFCNEPGVRDIIAQSRLSALIIEIAREALTDEMKENFNILHKCFFQVESGEILINQSTVDGILRIFCEAIAEKKTHDIDACGNFLAQTMPVFCAGENASQNVKNDVFLHLFELTIKYLESNESISEDTLWEVTTCWQDALSSGDILLDETLLRSSCLLIEKYIQSDELKPTLIHNMGDALSKLIMCSTEHIEDKGSRQKEIDRTIAAVFYSKSLETEKMTKLEDLCDILEATKCLSSVGSNPISGDCFTNVQMLHTFKRALLNLSTLKKLIYKAQPSKRTEPSEEECSEDYCDINENLLTEWSELTLSKMVEYLRIAAVGDSFVNNSLYPLDRVTEELILILSETVKVIMSSDCDIISALCESLIERASKEASNRYCRAIPYILHTPTYTRFEESSTIILEETLCNRFIDEGSFETYTSCLQYLLPNLSTRAISMQNPIMRCEPPQSWIKAAMFRCLIRNNFDNVTSNEAKDKNIALAALQFITDTTERKLNNAENLHYNTTVHDKPFCSVVNTIEFINLFIEVIEKFPQLMTLKHWDAVRLGLSSWILSASKSVRNFSNPVVFVFIARSIVLYEKLKSFIMKEKKRSSTATITNVIDEWENLFAREVDLVLFKIYYKLCDENDSIDAGCYALLMEKIAPAVNLIDYNFVYSANKELKRLSDLCNFLLKRLSNSLYSVRTCCANILRQMTPHFVAEDVLNFEKNSNNFSAQSDNPGFHFLNHFDDYLMRYNLPIGKYLKDFSFKLTEINDFSEIERNEALSYLLLWDCIIYACARSPVSLRSIYTTWLHENRHEESFLHFLFRAMPADILRNHDSKSLNGDIFKGLDFSQILQDSKIPIGNFACHMYTEILRKLPALVRKWWNECPSRQKTFVDKLTTNFVSALIVSEELRAISSRRDKHENMQVTVHNSTREVLAVYSIDEARMELVITLPPNYPLGAVKVECGKQIGGRASSRNIGMQLSIFLTHQNGTIFDGLTLWKGNLDKKFEGVEECYICYTVIHQDTCQLPKLSCKTCKKKFHGPCLYKWFTTSSKSTCPICRNVF